MRLIDSISLKNAVNAYANEPVKLNDRRWGIKCKAIIADMIGIIEEAPTVDAAPVKHGRWIENEGFDGDCYYTCSVCQCDWTTIDGTPTENNMRYCPECGAKMDLEDEQ